MSSKKPVEKSAARKKLTGALQETKSKKAANPKKLSQTDASKLQTKHMLRMYDKKVDLGRFEEDTPLFPIVRAWMASEEEEEKLPNYRNRKSPEPQKREALPNLLEDLKAGRVKEVTAMPAIIDDGVSRIPSPLPLEVKSEGSLDFLNSQEMSRQAILNEMKPRWKQVRQKWHDQAKLYEEKFKYNYAILDELFVPPKD